MINPTKLQQKEDTNEFISMSLGLVLKAGGKPTKPLLVLGKDARPFLRGGEKRNVSLFKVMPVPGRITVIRFALLLSDNLFSFPVRGCNIFVCYFEIGAPPQRPRSGTRKDPN